MGNFKKIVQRTCIFLIKIYRSVISPVIGNNCRFYPSCSNYALIAFERFGVLKGFELSLRRLLRCHPFHPGGCDPVPEQHEAKKELTFSTKELK